MDQRNQVTNVHICICFAERHGDWEEQESEQMFSMLNDVNIISLDDESQN